MSLKDAIENLPPLKDVIQAHDLRAQKSLGQNFLLDLNITDKIVRSAGDLKDKRVFEVGPGPGGLTRSILKTEPEKLTAIEFDRRAVGALQGLLQASDGRLEILESDALKVDIPQHADNKPAIIIANLPYNIATPLLMRWLRDIHDNPATYECLILMFQKEVVDRLCAQTRTSAYGRLSVITQWLCHVEKQFDLPPSVFVPPPKVTSTVVKLTPRTDVQNKPDFRAVEAITAAAFGQRRKMLKSSLKAYRPILDELGIDGEKRAEEIDREQFVEIARLSLDLQR